MRSYRPFAPLPPLNTPPPFRWRPRYRIERALFWLGMVPLLVWQWWRAMSAPSVAVHVADQLSDEAIWLQVRLARGQYLIAQQPHPLSMPSAGPGEKLPR